MKRRDDTFRCGAFVRPRDDDDDDDPATTRRLSRERVINPLAHPSMRAHARRASRLLARAPIDLSRAVSSTRASSSRATERRIGANVSTFILCSGLGLVGLLGAREATETRGSILDPERDACASDSDGDRARRARRWCERAGGTFSSCELGAAAARDEAARDGSRDGRGGVGAFARGVGGTLMTIPDAVTMNARSCAGDPALGETYVELARRGALDARTATMCMLMIERRRGEASAWREYVDALPRRYDAPLSFSEEELERELKGTPAFAAAKAQRASATKMFEENIRPAVRALTQADNAAGGSLHVLPEVSEREFLWAYQTFWSRAVSIPVGRGDAVESVVPGIDFVNHGGATKTNARWEHVVDANAPGGGYVALVWSPPRRRRPTEGEEIFIDYGEKSSESLLFTYGFTVEDDRPAADVLTVLPPWIDEAPEDRSELVSAKIAALRALGAPPRLTLPATPSRRGVVDLPTDALRVLQIWTASSVDAVADVARDASSGRRPRRLSAAAVADIRDALRASLGASSHALRELEDANAGRANEENSRSRACRAYRAARRRALDRWLEHLAT